MNVEIAHFNKRNLMRAGAALGLATFVVAGSGIAAQALTVKRQATLVGIPGTFSANARGSAQFEDTGTKKKLLVSVSNVPVFVAGGNVQVIIGGPTITATGAAAVTAKAAVLTAPNVPATVFTGGTLTVNVSGTPFLVTIPNDAAAPDIAAAINAVIPAATATASGATGKVVITSTATGTAATLQVSASAGLLRNLGFGDGIVTVFPATPVTGTDPVAAKAAKITAATAPNPPFAAGVLTITVNGNSFNANILANATAAQIASAINAAVPAAQASATVTGGKVVVRTANPGAAQTLQITGTPELLLGTGFVAITPSATGDPTVTADAALVVTGGTVVGRFMIDKAGQGQFIAEFPPDQIPPITKGTTIRVALAQVVGTTGGVGSLPANSVVVAGAFN